MHKILDHPLVTGSLVLSLTILPGCENARGHANGGSTPADTLAICTYRLPEKLTFCGEPVPLDIPEVRERAEREFYINLQTPGQIMLYIKRAARYFPTYEHILREAGVPDDLKYLSVAESALFMARSPKDAVGLWQFIPSTGRAYGLVITEEIDERRHLVRSTKAAVSYLRAGFDSNGSWANAAAGYNMGHENLSGNIRFQMKTNYYDLFLNEETSRYLLRIAIIKHIMEHAHEYGIVVPVQERYTAPDTRVVRVSGAVTNLAMWASANGTTYKDVKLLNPWILGRGLPAPPAGRVWEVEVPA
jgi:hypothetical protein